MPLFQAMEGCHWYRYNRKFVFREEIASEESLSSFMLLKRLFCFLIMMVSRKKAAQEQLASCLRVKRRIAFLDEYKDASGCTTKQ